MKKILLLVIVLLLLLHTNCTAQNVYPMRTSALDTPRGSYMKDLNNELNPYVGRWKTVYKGKEITLIATKEYKVPFLDYYYRDIIVVRYEIKDTTNGNILESTLNRTLNDDKYKISGFKTAEADDRLRCVFFGGNCNLGNGFVFLKRQGNNQLLWSYYPQAILVTSQNEKECKGEIYLPEGENIVFTRQ
ncbi:DUF6705 family protein [Riemerella anatipestifer]|uniref:DUF6705 family protein n=1 Tax=Riemerella anatipestifer TaxID=34085 RepID=UPI001BDA1705|nr:DUF6705 family protein [Riemerella anatipestifer]MBT0551726.1 hypothetical protein [Riemerella anatipestifer]MBT0553193.1 hypothetical protein [Riemerella anatipestifer]MCU7559460.1 hypothetical protein [Riemerella anatipestifer]QYR01804.1 hypothetical protein J6M00_06190 [Riemerella anatipestifer]QYR04219.1 hypothetical protein J6M09_07045 [Riemerella anatipestifer]